MPPPALLSLESARRLALASQGFARARPETVSAHDLAATIRRIGLLQLDFVNVVCPSHFLVPYARLGAYPLDLLHDVVYRRGLFTEQWAHEASIVPMEVWPLLRDRRELHRARPWGFDDIMRRHRAYAETVLAEIRDRGPLGPADLPDPQHTKRRLAGSWYGNVPRAVLEAHFGRGRLAVVARRPDFSRVFDLAERAIPGDPFEHRLDAHDAHRRLLLQAAHAHGVATAADLADYYRMPVSATRPRVAELVAGIGEPTPVNACALLSPFDPIVWFRPRTRRLFAFDYRFEIFIPPAKRRWGSYVLPFLLGDQLVARVDLKTDRKAGRLRVNGAWIESHAAPAPVAPRLVGELHNMANWLGLTGIAFGRRGNLMRALRAV